MFKKDGNLLKKPKFELKLNPSKRKSIVYVCQPRTSIVELKNGLDEIVCKRRLSISDLFSKKIKRDSNFTYCDVCSEELPLSTFTFHCSSLIHKLFDAQNKRRLLEESKTPNAENPTKIVNGTPTPMFEYFKTTSDQYMKSTGYIYSKIDENKVDSIWRCIFSWFEEKPCETRAKIADDAITVVGEHNHTKSDNYLIVLESIKNQGRERSPEIFCAAKLKEIFEAAHGIQSSRFGKYHFYCAYCKRDFPSIGPSSARNHVSTVKHVQNENATQSANSFHQKLPSNFTSRVEHKFKEAYAKCFTGIQLSSKGADYFHCACCSHDAPILHEQTVQHHVGSRKHIVKLKAYKERISFQELTKQEKTKDKPTNSEELKEYEEQTSSIEA